MISHPKANPVKKYMGDIISSYELSGLSRETLYRNMEWF